MNKILANFYMAQEEMEGEAIKPKYTASNRYGKFYLKLLDDRVSINSERLYRRRQKMAPLPAMGKFSFTFRVRA